MSFSGVDRSGVDGCDTSFRGLGWLTVFDKRTLGLLSGNNNDMSMIGSLWDNLYGREHAHLMRWAVHTGTTAGPTKWPHLSFTTDPRKLEELKPIASQSSATTSPTNSTSSKTGLFVTCAFKDVKRE